MIVSKCCEAIPSKDYNQVLLGSHGMLGLGGVAGGLSRTFSGRRGVLGRETGVSPPERDSKVPASRLYPRRFATTTIGFRSG